MITIIKRWLTQQRIALNRITIDQHDAEIARLLAKLEELDRREIDLRIRLACLTPLERKVSYPS